MLGGIRERVVIICGTDSSRELYNIAGVIKMQTNTKKFMYSPAAEGTPVHMFTYKTDNETQKLLEKSLKEFYQHLSFTYLSK